MNSFFDFQTKAIKRMYKKKSTKKQQFECEVCHLLFSRLRKLTRHNALHLGVEGQNLGREFRCEVCAKRFSSAIGLEAHETSHLIDKPFKCDMCPRQYSNKELLVFHRRRHTGEKPFQCKFCHEKFASRNRLKRHTGPRRRLCTEFLIKKFNSTLKLDSRASRELDEPEMTN